MCLDGDRTRCSGKALTGDGGKGFTSGITVLDRTPWKAALSPWVLALTDSELCLQVTRNKAFLRDVKAVLREQLPLFTATGGESKAPGEEASKAEAFGSLPSASQSLKERSPCVAMLHGIPWAGESPPHTQGETLPEPQITCCQLSETHRNRSVFFILAAIRTWRNMGEVSK